MKKHVFGWQLQRDTNERKALFKSLMTSLVLHESIQTTETKAKAIKGEIDKLVTKAKTNKTQAERALQAYFAKPVLQKFIQEVTPRFADRPGGYTRIIKIGNRFGDNAKMVILEWVVKKPEVIQGEVVEGTNEKITDAKETSVDKVQAEAKRGVSKKKSTAKPKKEEKISQKK